MAVEQRIIRVILDAKDDASRAVKDALGKISNSLKAVEKDVRGISSLSNVFSSLFAANVMGVGIGQLARMADSIQLVESRLVAFNGSVEQTTSIMQDLKNMARETKAPFADIANTFSRVAVATNRLNLGTDAQVGLTKALVQSFKLSGSSAEESAAASLQFSQALSFGQLRGQELRSVLSQNAVLAGVFSKAIEGSGKDIYKFAEAGGFTTKFVLKALSDSFVDINKKANTMATTFEQSVNIAITEFTIAVDNINKKFNLSENFFVAMKWLVDNSDIVAAGIVGISVAMSTSLLPTIARFGVFLASFGWVGILLGTIAALATVVMTNMDRFSLVLEDIGVTAQTVGLEVLKTLTEAKIGIQDLFGGASEESKKDLADLNNQISILQFRSKDLDNILNPKVSSLPDIKDYSKALAEASKNMADPPKTLNEQIAALNLSFNKGKIDVLTYNKELLRLQNEVLKEEVFKKATKGLEDMNKEMSKNRMDAFARELEYGVINIEQFDEKVNNFKLEELNRKFSEGKITLQDYRIELAKLNQEGIGSVNSWTTGVSAGIAQASKDIGTASQAIASVTSGAFKSMEDAIFQSTKGSTRAFADMVQAILDDLTRLVIRMAIIRPLTQGVLGLMGGGDAGGAGGNFTNASSINNTVAPFASGGIVSSPTMFGSAGRLGIAGEAGPEAILPLSKMADGSLGVSGAGSNTVINIINNSGNDVQQSESTGPGGEKVIDILIMGKVKEGIASGAFDKSFQSSFGLRRRGV